MPPIAYTNSLKDLDLLLRFVYVYTIYLRLPEVSSSEVVISSSGIDIGPSMPSVFVQGVVKLEDVSVANEDSVTGDEYCVDS